ncbi:MAG: cyanophycinase [Planctomycetes bacterium]|nr:cyanophycinase [Planctomycetota bacterium]
MGGAIDKVQDPTILKRFVKLCGGKNARIAVIPTASTERSTGQTYEELFLELGVLRAVVLPFENRADCAREDWLEILDESHGVFLTGGNQLRLSTTLGGTPVAKLLRTRNEGGLHVAGSSAGAAFLSEHMIAFGDEGSTPRHGMVTLAPGLGLTNRIIVDQHFRQRDRLGRLLTALAYNPFAIGVGLDENTAAFIDGDETVEVVGTGGLTIVDPSGVEYTTADLAFSAQKGEPVSLVGVKLHILVRGDRYNLHTRHAEPALKHSEQR